MARKCSKEEQGQRPSIGIIIGAHTPVVPQRSSLCSMETVGRCQLRLTLLF